MRTTAFALTLLVAISAAATTIAPGDLAYAPPPLCWGGTACIATPPPPNFFLVNDALTVQQIRYGLIVAFGPNNQLFVDGLHVYDASLNLIHDPLIDFYPSAVTVAQNGDVYLLNSSGRIAIYSLSGVLQKTFAVSYALGQIVIPPSFDLAPDQCTIFYTDGAETGHRFNACTGQQLPDIPGGPWVAIRALADGGYVAAKQSTLSIFDAHDHLVRALAPEIGSGNITALAFAADPHALWIGTNIALVKIDFASGRAINSGGTGVVYLAVNGEQRPTSAVAIAPQDVPSLSPSLLAVLAFGLIVLAILRLR